MAIDKEKLKELAWKVFEPNYINYLNELTEKYRQAKANKLESDEIRAVAKAATEGRVATLLIEADRIIQGAITNERGSIKK